MIDLFAISKKLNLVMDCIFLVVKVGKYYPLRLQALSLQSGEQYEMHCLVNVYRQALLAPPIVVAWMYYHLAAIYLQLILYQSQHVLHMRKELNLLKNLFVATFKTKATGRQALLSICGVLPLCVLQVRSLQWPCIS